MFLIDISHWGLTSKNHDWASEEDDGRRAEYGQALEQLSQEEGLPLYQIYTFNCDHAARMLASSIDPHTVPPPQGRAQPVPKSHHIPPARSVCTMPYHNCSLPGEECMLYYIVNADGMKGLGHSRMITVISIYVI